MYEKFFAERLSYLREKKGISAREMSLAIGQNESYINHIENQKAFPSMQSFFYICEYLGISPKDFFDQKNPDPYLMTEINAVLRDLPADQLNIILNVAKTFRKRD